MLEFTLENFRVRIQCTCSWQQC